MSGLLHLVYPEAFLALIPQNRPVREGLNALAGVAEILLGAGFLWNRTRRMAGYIICMMLTVFWVLHGIHLVHPPKPEWPFWGYLLRFLLQPVLIILVWKLKDCPPNTVK